MICRLKCYISTEEGVVYLPKIYVYAKRLSILKCNHIVWFHIFYRSMNIFQYISDGTSSLWPCSSFSNPLVEELRDLHIGSIHIIAILLFAYSVVYFFCSNYLWHLDADKEANSNCFICCHKVILMFYCSW